MDNINIKASFIITKNEAAFLLERHYDKLCGAVAGYLRDILITSSVSVQEAMEGLALKMMARVDSDALRLEPVVDFLLSEVMAAERFWRLEEEKTALVIRTAHLWLLITVYALSEDTYRVTPYQNGESVGEALKETYGFSGSLEFLQ